MSYINFLEKISSIVNNLQKEPYPLLNVQNYKATLQQIQQLKAAVNNLEEYILKKRKIVGIDKNGAKRKSDDSNANNIDLSYSQSFSSKNISSASSINSFGSILERYNINQSFENEDINNDFEKFDEVSDYFKSQQGNIANDFNMTHVGKSNSNKVQPLVIEKQPINGTSPLLKNYIPQNDANLHADTREKENNSDILLDGSNTPKIRSPRQHPMEKELYEQYNNNNSTPTVVVTPYIEKQKNRKC